MYKNSLQHLSFLCLLFSLITISVAAQDSPEESRVPSYSSLSSITATSNFFYFALNDDVHGLELWRSDGTPGGTHLIKDINPGGASSSPSKFLLIGNTLYFLASDEVHGNELWKSDGTTAGTVLVKDVYPGTTSSSIDFLTDANGTLYFQADNGIDGIELWKSDGTTSGTKLVRDIFAGSEPSYPDFMTELNGLVYFRAGHPAYGYELWKTDGTREGTTLVKDFNVGQGDGSPIYIVKSGAYLYLAASPSGVTQQLWKSDGTAEGTIQLGSRYPLSIIPSPAGGVYFFGELPATGRELWKSDGTTAGTVLVKDIYAGATSSIGFNQGKPVIIGDKVYLAASSTNGGKELWGSNGAAAGTQLIKDINPGIEESYISDLTVVGSSLYFGAYDGEHGSELWTSDGTSKGTRMVSDIFPGSASSLPRNFQAFNGRVFFSIFGDNGAELWISDGTTDGTVKIFPASEELPNVYVTSPADGAQEQKVQLNITAKAVPGASSYTVQLSPTPDFSSGVISKIGPSRTQRFTDLQFDTEYFARVTTNVNSQYGRTTSFTTTSPNTYAYVIYPGDQSTDINTTVNVTANNVPYASTYTIELNTQLDFNPSTAVVKSGSRTIKFGGLMTGSTYYTRVRTNLSSEWGEVRSFQTVGGILARAATGSSVETKSGEDDIVVNVSPNPFTDKLLVRVDSPLDESIDITLVDINSTSLFYTTAKTNLTIEIETPLQRGLYVVRVSTRKGVESVKVAKRD